MFKVIPSFILLVAITTVASAQYPPEVGESSESNIHFYTSNHGIFGLNMQSNSAGFVSPRGSGKSYLFGSGLWFGARKRVNDQLQDLVFITYNPNSGASWAWPGEWFDSAGAARPALYHSTAYDHSTGEFNLPTVPPLPPPNWPLWLRSGQDATALSPGEFVLRNADRVVGSTYPEPAFMASVDEQFFARFNDKSLSFYEIASAQAQEMGYPLGLQIQQHISAWGSGDFSNVVLIQYDVINVSSDTLYDCAIAQAADPDLGLASNDRLGFYTARPELRTSYVWTEQETEEYGALAITLMEGPVTDNDGFVDNSRRSDYLQNGRVGTSPNWTIQNDPKTPQERYAMMTNGEIETDAGAGDRRTLLATTKFHMLPGDTAHYSVVFAVLSERPSKAGSKGHGGRSISSAGVGASNELEALMFKLNERYYHNVITNPASVPVSSAATGLNAVPNPATSSATIGWTMTERSRATIEVRNSIGERIMTKTLGTLEAGNYQEQLDVTTLPAGVYIVVVRNDQGARATRLAITR
jgi:hypothetical protein